ncbi:thioredoxin domain-containing protein [Candidatus Chlamydia sanziniae]|uniref:Thymidylate kinase n=1 Tax=Candidatus Chlamydia sanziniae TaxID=1806891 RepID=A0A1A9HVS7_9CHLA|nr:thioredoxin domain-containing protein [Candidatus Chlamydia sanziniae]ANH78222.1 Thymidylate kinase [Candidatus Chlamydia sanziniae]
MSEPLYTNKLIAEKSPYLLLYAHTPVNWYPWGPEAFHIAAIEDKPIFLSIGCTQSRWCRVMLQESYTNPEVAAMLNEYFVNIKVDKEELPHIAKLYCDLAQMLSVSGGQQEGTAWPLNVFLTPDLLPFFSINYIGVEGKLGLPSFPQVIDKLHLMWEDSEEKDMLIHQAMKVTEIASFLEGCFRKELLEESALRQTVEALYHDIDGHYGGIKAFPKRTPGLLIRFFLRYGNEYQDSRSIFFAERSLTRIAAGGIRDHIGGGVYTYTIDDKWLIPCFEKRLIDNALMALNYLEAWAYTKRESYYSIGQQGLSYILSELYDGDVGTFYNSEQAENWGGEAKNFYTWSGEEIRNALGPNAELFCEYYGISREGFCNGRNILHIPAHIELKEIAEKYHCSVEEFEEMLEKLQGILKSLRDRRTLPLKDDLSLSFNNGWMIYILAHAGRLLGEFHYIHIAEKCGKFVRDSLYKHPTLLRRWREGEAKYRGGLEDYGALILGSLALYESGCGACWLSFAEELMQEVLISFRAEGGGFYSTDGQDTTLLIKQSPFADGESISGNALVCEGLLSLYLLTEKKHYFTHAEEILQLAQAYWHTHKFSSLGHLLAAQNYFSRQHKKILISLGNEHDRKAIFQCFSGLFLPHISIVWMTKKDKDILETVLSKYEHSLIPQENQTTSILYVLDANQGRKFQDLEAFRRYLASS